MNAEKTDGVVDSKKENIRPAAVVDHAEASIESMADDSVLN
jgi:hypothetical protein